MRTAVPFRFVLSAISVLCGLSVPSFGAEVRPNILFLYTDDQAPTAAGFTGNRELHTPNIDRIAREGAILANSFVTTPVCSPSRAGLATSRYGTELGILDWINPRTEPELGLDPNRITWMELFQQSGYRLGLFGKWHLGTADHFHPTLTGYDDFVGIRSGGCAPKDATIEVGGHLQKQSGYTCDIFTDHALKFIERNRSRPFVVSLHFRAPHAAWLPVRPEDWAPYKDLDPTLPDPDFPHLKVNQVKKMLREYYASIASVDRNVGRVLEALDRLGLTERTIVIFTSDHGYHTGHHGLWYKGNAHWMTDPLPEQRWAGIPRKRRPNLYDQALRVPTAICWPGVIAPGSVFTETFTNLDWYPTLAEMAGVELLEDVILRGESYVPVLRGTSSEWDNNLYAEYSMRHGATVDMRCWRTPEWKLILDLAHPGRGELYHLKQDPGEERNLFDSDQADIRAVQERLESKLRDYLQELKRTVAARKQPRRR